MSRPGNPIVHTSSRAGRRIESLWGLPSAWLSHTSKGPSRTRANRPSAEGYLRRLSQGLTNTGIADELSLSVSAVEKHLSAIFTKLGVTKNPIHNQRVRAVLIYLERNAT
ncbi:LuxR C-terminal-related transcriptional regulator [Nocardia sp. NBC_00508]|uniref:response regulator transcription factor n=1 Tax=Nocardia sp. NBC_00508 TaxID=2975992 RepID=UPI002E80945D|nr:LuxR C-terminal-related transcriptional regulator [Nocardia sp. NBC_00508]WUD66112.1 LuxR C-terminal-related transcriptional regulator [Nocardia sp. NBC_00508]